VIYTGTFDAAVAWTAATANGSTFVQQGNTYRLSKNGANSIVTIQNTIVAPGESWAQKSVVIRRALIAPGNDPGTADYRAELEELTAPRPAFSATPIVRSYDVAFYLPSVTAESTYDETIFQLHSTAWVPFSLLLKGNEVRATVLGTTYILGAKTTLQPFDQWRRWTAKIGFSTANNGFVEVYNGATLVWSKSDIQTYKSVDFIASDGTHTASETAKPKKGGYPYNFKFGDPGTGLRDREYYHGKLRITEYV
jgi:hypothetical protein